MKWNRYTLKTTVEAEDIIISEFADIGIEGVEIEDNQPLTEDEISQMFVDIPPEYGPDDGTAKLHFYLDPDEDNEAVLARAREVLNELSAYVDVGEASITASSTEDIDWINNWKEFFHSFTVDDILVIPSWEEVPEDGNYSMVLHIDPGTAFGTGMHETTQLCIRQLKKYVRENDLQLDIGTGSGILGIVGLKLGVREVFATDLDPCTISAVDDNKASNDIPKEKITLVLGNITDDKETQELAGYDKYDIVTANILADILIPMAGAAAAAMKKGGIIITSGILDYKAPDVAAALEGAGLTVLETTFQGEWASVTARK